MSVSEDMRGREEMHRWPETRWRTRIDNMAAVTDSIEEGVCRCVLYAFKKKSTEYDAYSPIVQIQLQVDSELSTTTLAY